MRLVQLIAVLSKRNKIAKTFLLIDYTYTHTHAKRLDYSQKRVAIKKFSAYGPAQTWAFFSSLSLPFTSLSANLRNKYTTIEHISITGKAALVPTIREKRKRELERKTRAVLLGAAARH